MTAEQQQRIREIQNSDQPWRKDAYELGDVIAGHESDVEFLLSVVKDQETQPMLLPGSPLCIDPPEQPLVIRFLQGKAENGEGEAHLQLCLHCQRLVGAGAVAMRKACVEKVRAFTREKWQKQYEVEKQASALLRTEAETAIIIAAILESVSIQE